MVRKDGTGSQALILMILISRAVWPLNESCQQGSK